MNLLAETGEITLVDGLLCLDPQFISRQQGDRWFKALHAELDWTQPTIRLFGREVLSPRLAAWHGDAAAVYTYSGLRNEPAAWTGTLSQVRRRVESALGCGFNSVLANLYRDGNDSMGWHSDDERELDQDAVIASVSLGQTRKFRLQHRRHKHCRLEIPLSHGALLVMHPPTQQHWRHSVPRERTVDGPRINLTFRSVR